MGSKSISKKTMAIAVAAGVALGSVPVITPGTQLGAVANAENRGQSSNQYDVKFAGLKIGDKSVESNKALSNNKTRVPNSQNPSGDVLKYDIEFTIPQSAQPGDQLYFALDTKFNETNRGLFEDAKNVATTPLKTDSGATYAEVKSESVWNQSTGIGSSAGGGYVITFNENVVQMRGARGSALGLPVSIRDTIYETNGDQVSNEAPVKLAWYGVKKGVNKDNHPSAIFDETPYKGQVWLTQHENTEWKATDNPYITLIMMGDGSSERSVDASISLPEKGIEEGNPITVKIAPRSAEGKNVGLKLGKPSKVEIDENTAKLYPGIKIDKVDFDEGEGAISLTISGAKNAQGVNQKAKFRLVGVSKVDPRVPEKYHVGIEVVGTNKATSDILEVSGDISYNPGDLPETCDACAEIDKLKGRVSNLEGKVKDLATKSDISDIQKQLNEMKESGGISQNRLVELTTRINELETRINEVHETANNAQKTANEAIKQIATERERVNEIVKDIENVKKGIKTAQDTANQAVKQSDELKKQADDLQRQLDIERSRIDKNESEIKRLESELKKTNDELKKHTKRIDDLYKKVAEHGKRLDTLQKELGKTNKRIDELKTEFDELVKRVEKNETDLFWLAAVVAQHEKELAEARDAIKRANDLIAELRIDVDEAREIAENAQLAADKAREEIAAERARVDAITVRVDALENELSEARKVADQALSNSEANAQEIDAAKARIASLETELKDLKGQLAAALTVLYKHEKAIDALGDKITEVEAQLKEEIKIERERINKLNERIDAQQVQIKSLATQLDDHDARLKNLEGRVDTHELMRCTVEKSSARVLPLAALAIPMGLLATMGSNPHVAQANTNLQKQLGIYNEQLAGAMAGLNANGNPLAGLGAVIASLVAISIGYEAYSSCATDQGADPIQVFPRRKGEPVGNSADKGSLDADTVSQSVDRRVSSIDVENLEKVTNESLNTIERIVKKAQEFFDTLSA